jgi:hypothetical protein
MRPRCSAKRSALTEPLRELACSVGLYAMQLLANSEDIGAVAVRAALAPLDALRTATNLRRNRTSDDTPSEDPSEDPALPLPPVPSVEASGGSGSSDVERCFEERFRRVGHRPRAPSQPSYPTSRHVIRRLDPAPRRVLGPAAAPWATSARRLQEGDSAPWGCAAAARRGRLPLFLRSRLLLRP